MWQAISRLLSEQVGEGEIGHNVMNCRAESPCRMAFTLYQAMIFRRCDEREMLRGFTAGNTSAARGAYSAVKPLLCLRYGR
ncbi:hypothetical protein KCP73_24430 [Salmonella enterica subsp. enterica]|nr:hypothetical protein KCP73_24430 [Salmonella enterica subsp. enterica]